MVHASRGRLDPPAPAPAQRGRRSCAGLAGAALGRRTADRPTGPGSQADYDRIRDHIAGVVPGFERLQRPGRASPAASSCPTRPATAARFPTATGKAQLHRRTRSTSLARAPTAGCCCRPSARTTSTTPPSTASTTATAASRSGRRVVFVHPEDLGRARLRRRRLRRHRQRVGRRPRAPRPRRSASSPTRPPAGCAPPTSPRPTCSSPSTARPTPAAPPPRSRRRPARAPPAPTPR